MQCDITIFQPSGKNYNRTVINSVVWQGKVAVDVDTNGGLKAADGIKIFIPESSMNIQINSGDTVVQGVVDKEISLVRELHEAYDNVITVMAVKYCTSKSGRLNHWEVIGK